MGNSQLLRNNSFKTLLNLGTSLPQTPAVLKCQYTHFTDREVKENKFER